ncbi:hypothetical protein [Cohnella boryungensis]|uniref:MotA/TolQ/ExbB proton channel domain-containing protein n=1 Tax=Cohnella boryungensis TaxID=768479 RepID=A0ABV8SFY5_9BACL
MNIPLIAYGAIVFLVGFTLAIFIYERRSVNKELIKLDKPIARIVHDNELEDFEDVIRLKSAYKILKESNGDKFENSLLNLKIMEKQRKLPIADSVSQTSSLVIPLITFMPIVVSLTIELIRGDNTIPENQSLLWDVYGATTFFLIFLAVCLYSVFSLSAVRLRINNKVLTQIISHLLIAEEVSRAEGRATN